MFGEGEFPAAAASDPSRITHAPDATFRDILRKHAVERPHKTVFVFLDSQGDVAEQYTVATLDRRARRIATELAANGLHGQRVLLIFPPGLDFIAALFACFYAGAVAVPIPFLPGKGMAERIASIHRDADPAGALTLSRLRNDTQISASSLRTDGRLVWISVDTLDPQAAAQSSPAPTLDTLALLQYTSGSISSPKGVMLNHANLIANCEMIVKTFGHDLESRGLTWLPPFHDMGLIGHILYPMFGAALSVLMSPLTFLYRPHVWLQAISTWKATSTGGPNFAFDLCVKSVRDDQIEGIDLSTWRTAYCGAERIQADVLDRFSSRFGAYGFQRRSLLPSYGLAEATLLVTSSPVGKGVRTDHSLESSTHRQPAVSCGVPPPHGRVTVVDPDTRLTLADGMVGEIWVQGPHVAQGYWGAATDTGETFRATLADGSGPYLRTGDLGFLKAGELFVVGRIKNTIIIYGNKHSAEDIETAVMRSHALFAGFAGAAFGVDVDGQEQAVVVQEVARKDTSSEALEAAAADGFAAVTRDYGLRLFDLVLVRAGALPRTANGKIRRDHARQHYLDRAFKRLNPHGRDVQVGRANVLSEEVS